MTDADGVHPQFIAGADLSHGTIADNEHFVRTEPEFVLNPPECCFLRQKLVTICVEDVIDCGITLQTQGSDFCFLDLRLAKADDEDLHAA